MKNIFIKIPFKVIKILKSLFMEIFITKMPLSDFSNYDEYWGKRGSEGNVILFRYKYVAEMLPMSSSVLDVGCGDGRFLKYLKNVKPNLVLFGIDQSEVAINKLKMHDIKGKIVDLTRESISNMQQEMRIKFDYIVVMELLEHLYDPETLMRDLRNIGAKRYFITIPNLGFIVNRLRLAIGGKMPVTNIFFHIREYIRFWTFSDFKYWSKNMGFKLVVYHGQYGITWLWKLWPSLFASGMIYVLEIDNNYKQPIFPEAKT